MRYILILLFALIVSFSNAQQVLMPVDNAENVTFTIKNLGIAVDGKLSGLKGKIVFDEKDLSKSYFDVSVDANTINTGIAARDNHLKKDEYFGVTKNPKLFFKSTKVFTKDNITFTVIGNITIKGITKPIQFDFKTTKYKDGSTKFSTSFNLNRRTFNIGGKSITMSDVVNIKLNVTAK